MKFMTIYEVKMNIVILCGKLQEGVEFNFIYDSKYVSIAKGSLILNSKNIVNIYGYDEIADYMYQNEDKIIWAEGKVRENGVEIKEITNRKIY